MNFGFRISDFGWAWSLVCIFALCVQAADNDALRQKQQAQETARALAGDLVSAVLDIQLRQLEENGLKSLPVYRDIAAMKGNIAGLIASDMPAVVELLIEAQEGSPQNRLAKLNAARAKIRDVVVQLMAERQKLYRRLQLTRLSAEAQQLIGLQTTTNYTTRTLLDRRSDDRERLALAVIEDQADVNKLYYQLLASLTDVSSWGGAVAAGASDGLRILRAAQVEPELKQAGQSLERGDFSQTAVSQRAVLKGLSALLDKLDETQGLIDGDREAALRLVRELIARQHDLREQTGQTELSERTAEPLIEQQTRLHKELSKLAAALTKFPATGQLAEQAKAASFEATASLFEEKREPALDKQGRVIAHLTQIEKLLLEGLNRDLADKSAAELAAIVARLQELKTQLEKVEREQLEAGQSAASKPGLAAQQETQVTQTLTHAKSIGDFTAAIESRLEDAVAKVTAAEQSMRTADSDAADVRRSSADDALAAIRAAQAEVAAELADARRRQKAVEVGELARAAEALERAAAAESEIARVAGEASAAGGLTAPQSIFLSAEQADIAAVAEKIAAGVQDMAPKANEILRLAAPDLTDAARALDEALAQPGEQNKPAAGHTSASTEKVTPRLIAAAAALRAEQVRAARELESIAAEQLTAADTVRLAVDKATESAKNLTSQSLDQLEQARREVAKALAEHARAEGRPEQAAAQELHEHIAALIRQQHAVDQAALDLARGRSVNPLHAATQQQEVSEKSIELAARSPTEIAQPLNQTAKSAAVAARETLDGNATKADSARQQARSALNQALQATMQADARAAQSPAGPPDTAAQARVSDNITAAEQLKSSASLVQAKKASSAARAQLQSANLEQARVAQREVHSALESATKDIDDEISALTAQQAGELAKQAQQAEDLSDQARQIDPGAAAALAQARQASLSPARTAAEEAQGKFTEAATSLAARQQQLFHDRDLAKSLAELALEQQAARDAITSAVQQLRQQKPDQPNAPEQIAAAQDLAQAQQQFAAAQTATGEGAADVSGQQEVANQPIREGLEIASRLGVRGQQSGNREQDSGERGQSAAKPDADANPKSENPNSKASALGTRLVPASPQLTAKQIAGPQANAAAAAMAAALKGLGKAQPGQGQGEGESETPQEGAASSTAKKGGATKGGKTAKNQTAKKGDLESADAADADSRGELVNQDTTVDGLKLENQAWFAKLPPELRSAIQAKSRGKPPRGYEERLRRYFEGVD